MSFQVQKLKFPDIPNAAYCQHQPKFSARILLPFLPAEFDQLGLSAMKAQGQYAGWPWTGESSVSLQTMAYTDRARDCSTGGIYNQDLLTLFHLRSSNQKKPASDPESFDHALTLLDQDMDVLRASGQAVRGFLTGAKFGLPDSKRQSERLGDFFQSQRIPCSILAGQTRAGEVRLFGKPSLDAWIVEPNLARVNLQSWQEVKRFFEKVSIDSGDEILEGYVPIMENGDLVDIRHHQRLEEPTKYYRPSSKISAEVSASTHLPESPAAPLALRFGWDHKNPPPNLIQAELTPKHYSVIREKRVVPSKQLVEEAAEVIADRGNTSSRVFYIPALTPVIKSIEVAREFQAALTRGVFELLRGRYGSQDRTQQDASQPIEYKGFNIKNAQRTNSALHFDDRRVLLNSLVYYHFENMEGGEPLVADLRQYAADRGLDVQDLLEPPDRFGATRVRDGHHEQLLTDYTLSPNPFDPEALPLLLFSNCAGIVHGRSEPRAINPGQGINRRLSLGVMQEVDLSNTEPSGG